MTPFDTDSYQRGYQTAIGRSKHWSDRRLGVALKTTSSLVQTLQMQIGLVEYVHGLADGFADILRQRHALAQKLREGRL